jgi:Flp pilus assembly protein TadG
MLNVKSHTSERGQAVVEFAIVLPLLLLLLMGIWQFGVVYDKWQNLNGAAREGARAAIVAKPGLELSDARSAARAAVAGQLTLSDSELTLTTTTIAGTAAWKFRACDAYSIDILGIVVKSGNLCRDATMRDE